MRHEGIGDEGSTGANAEAVRAVPVWPRWSENLSCSMLPAASPSLRSDRSRCSRGRPEEQRNSVRQSVAVVT